jgi:D-3-phosphoglycerate dehydrogenase
MKILITDPVAENAVSQLKEFADVELATEATAEELPNLVKDAEVIVVRSRTKITKEIIEAAPNLKAVARAGVGLDNIDTEFAKSKGIEIINTPEAPSEAVAELTIGLIFALLRKIPQADHSMKAKRWEKKLFKGKELAGKNLGIIGFGRIGHLVGQYAKALGMNIIVCDPHGKEDPRLKELEGKACNLEELLEQSDIITLHIPHTPETEGMLGENEFSRIKRGAFIVNTARAPVIDEKALINSLKNQTLAGAALDVYWTEPPEGSEILELDNVILTPHVGGSTHESQERIGGLLVKKIKEFVENA